MKKLILSTALALAMTLPIANTTTADELPLIISRDGVHVQSYDQNRARWFTGCVVNWGTTIDYLDTIMGRGETAGNGWIRVNAGPHAGCEGMVQRDEIARAPANFQSANISQKVFTAGRWGDEVRAGQDRRVEKKITLYPDHELNERHVRENSCDLDTGGVVSVSNDAVRDSMVKVRVKSGTCKKQPVGKLTEGWVATGALKHYTTGIGDIEVPVFNSRGMYYSARSSMDRDGHYRNQAGSVACKLKVGAKVDFKPFRNWGVGEVKAGNCSGWIDREVIR